MTALADRPTAAAPAVMADRAAVLDRITDLHTLGPAGTNCEAAAHRWFALQDRPGRVFRTPRAR